MEEVRFPFLGLNRLRMLTDGEGVTTLVAGSGCPLDCKYCINQKLLCRKPEWITAEELYERTKIDDLYFRATGGGVCFGGGEALLHVPFLHRFREVCSGEWRLYAETSLAVPPETIREAAQVVDGFIVDIKSVDTEIYRAYTGSDSCNLALSNLRLLLELRGSADIHVRIPLIPGFSTEEQQHSAEETIRSLGAERIECFSYVLPDEIIE